MKNFTWAMVAVLVGSCALFPGPEVDKSILEYQSAATRVKVGDLESAVLAILEPTQTGLRPTARKQPDIFMDGSTQVGIYYFRSAHIPDSLTTDDEFIPYQFRDGKLVSIGWEALGGPKTTGQSLFPDFSAPQPPVKVGNPKP